MKLPAIIRTHVSKSFDSESIREAIAYGASRYWMHIRMLLLPMLSATPRKVLNPRNATPIMKKRLVHEEKYI